MTEVVDFRSARQIHAVLRERGHEIGLATVYRNLHDMEQRGEVDVLRAGGGDTAVYRRCERHEHHHHLVCRRCGRAVEVEGPVIESWAARVARDEGFSEVTHAMELFGTCGACTRAERGRPRP
ncbi:transcriptional repressor [Cellulomonas triticagri]|uniref:Transcriptional repressor n=2 Tax=Cellulomonas triticagri TaxID=2483352 RepID=A0A3M2JLC1_9CELL|nr:transcriptional repressor [Cellulomonas triticagri]